MVASLPLVQQIQGSISSEVENFIYKNKAVAMNLFKLVKVDNGREMEKGSTQSINSYRWSELTLKVLLL